MACLQIYRELLLGQNKCPSLKTTCHIRQNFSCELNSQILTPCKNISYLPLAISENRDSRPQIFGGIRDPRPIS